MTKSGSLAISVIVTSVLFLAGAPAHAKTVAYVSMHPVPGKGFCNVVQPHEHDYEPHDSRLYRTVGGRFYFVGDPVPFGFHGRSFPFYGPHPVAESGVEFIETAYCYLEGKHSHWYEPSNVIWFERREGAFFYVGGFSAAYHAERPRYASINLLYHPADKVMVKAKVRQQRGRHKKPRP